MKKKLIPGCLLAAAMFFASAPANAALRFVPGTITGQVGTPVSLQLKIYDQSSGVDVTSFYVISPGNLSETGLQIAADGAVFGTPPAPTDGVVFAPVVISSAGSSPQQPQSLYLGVNISVAPLTITTMSLPSGLIGAGFLAPATLSASGGSPPYTWSITSGGLNGLALNPDGTFSGTFTTAGSVTVTIQVTDSLKATGRQAYTFPVYDAPSLPGVLTLPPAITGRAYSTPPIQISGGSSTKTWSATGLPAGIIIDATTGALGGTPTSAGLATVTLSVLDSLTRQRISSPAMPLIVYGTLTLTVPSFPPGVVGQPLSVTLLATGGAGKYLYSGSGIPMGLTLDPYTGVISGTPSTAGSTNSASLSVSDPGSNQTVSRTIPFPIYTPLTLSGPSALAPGVIGQPYPVVAFHAAGGSGNYDWSLAGGTYGLSISPSGQLSGIVTATSRPVPLLSGSLLSNPLLSSPGKSRSKSRGQTSLNESPLLNVIVHDSESGQTAMQSFPLQVYGGLSLNGPSALPDGTAGQHYPGVSFSAAGGSGTSSLSVGALPAGMSFNSSTGLLGGTPTAPGTYSVSITATDAQTNQSITQDFPLTIAYAQLSITGRTNLGTVPVNTSVSSAYSISGGKPTYTWSASGTMPGGMSLGWNGVLSGAPSVPGNYVITATASDSQSPAATASINISLGIFGFTVASGLPQANTAAPYSFSFAAAGGSGPYTFTGSGLPEGLTIAPNGVLSGQPKTPGTYSFSVTVLDAAGVQSSSSFTLPVLPAGAVKIQSSSPLSDAELGVPYSISLVAGNGNPPYTWSLTGGSLPDGLSLKSSGTLAGTPTKVGVFTFTVQAVDGSGGTAAAAFTMSVEPAALQITTASLPSGVVNIDYPQQILTATGGLRPYKFAISSGKLPDGLSLTDTTIGGVPTSVQSSSFTVTVTDSRGTQMSKAFQITIRPATTDLILSSSALNFALAVGAAAAPDPQSVTVRSSSPATSLGYSITAPSSAAWLNVSGGSGSTPSSIQFSLTPQALALTAPPAPATVTVQCAPNACPGGPQTITVSLNVSATPAKLTPLTDRLSFSTTTASSPPGMQTIQLKNDGGGVITVNSVSTESTWCALGTTSGTIPSGATLSIPVYANPAGLSAGYYRTTVDITTSSGTDSVPVTLLVAADGTTLLSPSGQQFSMPAGGAPGNVNGSFLISVAGANPIHWTAAVVSPAGADWLNLTTPSGTASAASPGNVQFSINPSAVTKLAAQAYYGTIRITSPDSANSPVDFQVVLNVAAASTPANPDPDPAGLIFLTSAGSSPLPQNVTVYTGSGTAGAAYYSASAYTTDGAKWLSVSPASGQASATSPAASAVSVDATNLKPGVYSGGVSYTLAGAGVRTVNVTLVVQAPVAAPLSQAEVKPHASGPGCSPTALAPTQTGLVNNFAAPTSWPTPLAIRLYNDCGAAVTNGQITVTFSNGDPPLSMPLVDSNTALYTATWTPRNSLPQVTVSARSSAPGFPTASARITGAVTPNKAPILARNGTLDVFNAQVGGSLAPGSVIQIYGTALAGQTATPGSLPLPNEVNGTSVIIGGMEAPLFFVSPGQIDAQVPFELAPGKQYQVVVSANGALTTPDNIALTTVAPGVAAFADSTIIAQHGADASLVTKTSPAAPGEFLVLYSSGLGATDNPVSTGGASPASPLARPVNNVTLTIDGAPANIAFAGLTPGLVGLYQINFQVPAGARNGDLPLVMTQNGTASNQTMLPVRK